MKRWSVLIILSMAMFIIVIDTTIMNVSISALVNDLDTTVTGVQSAISIYALVMASFILIGGKLADILGKKRTFLIGVLIFGIGTGTASFSTSLGMLIFGWSLLEGLGSALMMPNIQVLLRDEYEGADRATAYGIISAVGAVGAAVGPIVGGFLTTYYSWRWAFRMEVVIVVLVLLLSRVIAKDVLPARRPRFDYLGALLSIVGWAAIVLGILLIQSHGLWTAKKPFEIGQLAFAPFGISVVPFLVGFGAIVVMLLFRWERHMESTDGDGLFRPSILGAAGLKSGISVRFVQMAITSAYLFTAPLLMQLTFEFTAMETGVALIPFSLALLIAALIGARLSSRYSAKRIIQVGFVLSILGLIALQVTVKPEMAARDLATGSLFGVGVGLIASQILNLILSSVTPGQTPETTGLNGTFEQLGNAIGVALVGTMMLVSLNTGIEQRVVASEAIPVEIERDLIQAVDEGVQLVSSSQLEVGLEAAGVGAEVKDELLDIYAISRTEAFKAGIAFLTFLAIVGLIFTSGLSDRKLVGDNDAVG